MLFSFWESFAPFVIIVRHIGNGEKSEYEEEQLIENKATCPKRFTGIL